MHDIRNLYNEIDWEYQWQTFSPCYSNGYFHLDLFDQQLIDIPKTALKMKPGPGFGDFSHPTTRLMIAMMRGLLHGKTVIDIGCGSGILSLAAAAAGAQEVMGIDIDPGAIEHAKINAEINDLNISFVFPEEFVLPSSNNYLFLINMIPMEQAVAWNSLPMLHRLSGDFIVSGMLKQNRKKHLPELLARYGDCLRSQTEEGWSAYHFCKRPVFCNS